MDKEFVEAKDKLADFDAQTADKAMRNQDSLTKTR